MRVDALDVARDVPVAAQEGAEPQVVGDGERREDLPALRHMRHAEGDAPVRRRGLDPRAGEGDAAGRDRLHAGDRPQQRRLAGAVRADERDDLAGPRPRGSRPSRPRCGRRRCAAPRPQAWARPRPACGPR